VERVRASISTRACVSGLVRSPGRSSGKTSELEGYSNRPDPGFSKFRSFQPR
jgi:hypothetical protein